MNELQTGLVLLAVSGGLGWAFNIQQVVTSHQIIIEKLDQLLTLMLEDRLGNTPPRIGK